MEGYIVIVFKNRVLRVFGRGSNRRFEKITQ
jgi:hypothetical protein